MPKFDGIKVVLLDIEGTICPISFVKETLFPYALHALPAVLKDRWNDPTFASYRDAFPTEARQSPEAMIKHVEDLTARDVKIGYLKNLQGYLWQAGYESGAYSTPLFSDVTPQLQNWKKRQDTASSVDINIYSSGSVFAQKLLFAHVQEDGSTVDLTGLITDWFDTLNAGPKTEPASYLKIAGKLNRDPHSILFFSDNIKEVEAAIQVGMQSVIVDRPGNAPLSTEERSKYVLITSFDEIQLGS